MRRPSDQQAGKPLTIAIIDCGIGNIKSVKRMFEAVEADAEIIDSPDMLDGFGKLVLPGVGAFDTGMRLLEEGGWIEPLNRAVVERQAPMLGICLGMQLLCRASEEGERRGLGWIAADVVRLDNGGDGRIKIPHMGWAVTVPAKANPLIPADEEQRFYYVHSYRVACDDPGDVLATARHGTQFTSAVNHGKVFGVQFHPEKSHRFGMGLMRRFADLKC